MLSINHNNLDFLRQTNTIKETSSLTIDNIISNNQGIDTITLIAHYKTLSNIIKKDNLELQTDFKNLPINPYLKSIENQLKQDNKKRYKKEVFQPILEYVKLSSGNSLSNFMIIVRNTPLLFDYAINQKKAKDTFCQIIFSGLHQPTKKISSDSIKFISKILKRKTFNLHSLDLAIDYLNDKDISQKQTKTKLKELSKNNNYYLINSSIYCNNTKDKNISKFIIYDKYKKQSTYQKQKLSKNLLHWKRIEFELKPQTKTNFIDYIYSHIFYFDSLMRIENITKALQIDNYKSTYLEYQLSSIIDNRILNNKDNKLQFNSKDSLIRFIKYEYPKYRLLFQ